MKYPRSGFDTEGGLIYFPRMLDKIRLNQSGELPPEYLPFLAEGFDARCCAFLHVNYPDVVEQVRRGLSDAEILEWCFGCGTRPDEFDALLWNNFMTKRGWKDEDPEINEMLEQFKRGSGLGNRSDLQTFLEYFEVDEKRRP